MAAKIIPEMTSDVLKAALQQVYDKPDSAALPFSPYSPEYAEKLRQAIVALEAKKPEFKQKRDKVKADFKAADAFDADAVVAASKSALTNTLPYQDLIRDKISRALEAGSIYDTGTTAIAGRPPEGGGKNVTTSTTTKTTVYPDGKQTKETKTTATTSPKAEKPARKPMSQVNRGVVVSPTPEGAQSAGGRPSTDLNFDEGSNVTASPDPRFSPTPPVIPVVAQDVQAMPQIPNERYDTKGTILKNNDSEKEQKTKIESLAPLPVAVEKGQQEAIKGRLDQIEAAKQAESDFFAAYQPQVDLSSPLGWIGSQLGRDYLKGYTKPTGLGDLVAMRSKLEEAVGGARDDFSKAQTDYLKARLGLTDSQTQTARIADSYVNPKVLEKPARTGGGGDPWRREVVNQNRQYKANDDYANNEKKMAETLVKLQADVNAVHVLMDKAASMPVTNKKERLEYVKSLEMIRSKIVDIALADNVAVSKLGALAVADLKAIEAKIGADIQSGKLQNMFNNQVEYAREGTFGRLRAYSKGLADRYDQVYDSIELRYRDFPDIMGLHSAMDSQWKKTRRQTYKTVYRGRPEATDLSIREKQEIMEAAKKSKEGQNANPKQK